MWCSGVGDLIPGYPKEEESMNHRTVKTPESAVTSLARPNGSLVPPRPSAHVPLGPALPRPTAEGRLRLARWLEGDSASPDGWRATPPRPTAGLGFTRPPGGALRLAQPPRAGLGSIRRPGGDSASPDGWRATPPRPTAGLGFTRPPGDAHRLAQPPRAGLGPVRWPGDDSASPDG